MSSIRSSGNRSTEGAFYRLAAVAGLEGKFFRSCIARPADACSPELGIAVFLNGCFWHGCPHCYEEPFGRQKQWNAHLAENRGRDVSDYLELSRKGWKVLVVWEHEMRGRSLPEWFLREVTG